MPLAVITVPYVLIYLMAIPAALDGQLNGTAPPPVASLFGLIHLYTLIYAIGATVFLVAMKKERSEQRLLLEAQTDALTGLANRRAFLDLGTRVAERCQRRGEPLSVIVFDLDHFKSVNDTFGHAFGDVVLRTFATTAREALRPGDIASRVGGEEFFAVLPGATLKDGCATAERVRKAFADATALLDGRAAMTTVSVGVMASDDASTPLATLLEKADAALHRAKMRGRNCVECDGGVPAEAQYPRLVRVA